MAKFKGNNSISKKSFLSTNAFLALLGICLVAVSVFLWKMQESKNLSEIASSTETKARSYSSETEIRYNRIFEALDRLASRGGPRDEAAVDGWKKDASFYIDAFEGIKSIAWVDETFRIRQIVPTEDNLSYLNQTASEIEGDSASLNLWVPIYDGTEFKGYIFGIIDIEAFMAPVVQELMNDYMLQLSEEGVMIFESQNWKHPQEKFVVNRMITFKNTKVMKMTFTPTDEYIQSGVANAQRTFIFSLFISLITVVAVYFAQNFNAIAILNELRYRNLFEASRDAIFIINMDGAYQNANPAALAMVGYSLTELQQMSVSDLRPRNEALPQGERQSMWREGGAVELVLRHKDGHEIPIDLRISPIKEGGEQKLVLGIARDITERLRAEAVLKGYSEQLAETVAVRTRELQDAHLEMVRQEKLAILGQLAGGVAHELRNPLGVITNAIYYLKMALSDTNSNIREYLQLVDNETRIAARIVSDLLDFGQIRSVDRAPSQISEMVGRVIESNPPPETVTFNLDIPAELPPVFVDPGKIEQVLSNLVINAYQAMPDGGNLSIASDRYLVTSKPGSDDRITGNFLLITVRDTGSGIAPKNMEKLFEPLFTTKLRGIGLGLAVSKKLVEANGGQIEVESEPGKGAEFSLVLPVSEDES